MKVYYAHSIHLYGKPQETRDLLMLQDMGFKKIVNPSSKEHMERCKKIREECIKDYDKASEKIMDYFMTVVDGCDVVAFRAHPDGKIPSGVGMEVRRAIDNMMPIIELPTLLDARFLDKQETRKYLQYLGER